jgi:cyanate permease
MLAWNVSEYNGTYNIYVPIESVWMPDIVVSNGVGSSKFLSNNLRTDHVSVLSDGTVGW